MRIAPRTSIRTLAVLALTLVTATGCGGGDSGDDASADGSNSSSGVAALVHVDGVVAATDDGFTVTPSDGSAVRTFTAAPEIERSAVMALAASGEPARVAYRDGDTLVAAAIAPAPKLDEGVDAVKGLIVSVDASKLVIKTDDGERIFDISSAEPAAFDVGHLQEHADDAGPILVYFRADAPDAAVAYKDA